ncbi:MAG: CBS domain-containing protein [Cryomorphaceae bacterium]
MRAADLISDEIPTLEGTDNALFAMQLLDEFKMKQLPVVDGNEFLGLISDSSVMEIEDPEAELKDCSRNLQMIYVQKDQHVYDLIRVAAEFQLSAIPILNNENKYMGVVSIYCMVRELSHMASVMQPGGIVVLELNQKDYSLVEISQIVEGNDAKILSANITSVSDSQKIELTLKLNLTNIDAIIQTFNRYDYIISASFHESDFDDMIKDRYEELMRYINF